MRNVRERLHSEYGDDAVLQTGESNGRFVARIEIALADRRASVVESREQDPIDRELEEAKWEQIAAHRELHGPGAEETRGILEAAERDIEARRRELAESRKRDAEGREPKTDSR